MSAGRLRHDDEDLGDFVNRILEEPASTGTEPVGVEEEDNSEFDDNGSESSELFGGHDSDMDPEYLPSEDSSEDSDNDMNTLDQRQLVHNQLIQQQPNPHSQPGNGIQQRSRFDCVLMATETWPLVSSVGRPAPPPFITSVPQPMTFPRDLAWPDQGHVHVARPNELRNNKDFVSCVPKDHFAILCR
ncbi:hypothetical protein J6590_082767 [Homalodisca vitripennis]|nr:hypothetical protein J6590_082767 [Homalodisca vitripennis]